ncbi:GNAT family N-acetyltransferase [Subtercola lobariae]|uniref:GNAT family N-acetyltransferase n=1 Tax=Subtercola lobariae TaxID=1588641 RepID=UPI0035583958
MSVSLLAVDESSVAALRRLWQLCQHDLSEFRGTYPGTDGCFKTDRLESYLGDSNRSAHLIFNDAHVAGFALVRGVTEDSRALGEFFVTRAARRAGVGRDAAHQILRSHPGRWAIAFQDANAAAAQFWPNVARALVGTAWTLEHRPVPGKPDVPPDAWIEFELPQC